MVAETATRVLPHGSFAGGVGPSTAKRTLWAMPRMVRSPSTVNSPSPDDADALGFEVQGRKLLHIKEIGALQVRIALFIARMNRGRLDRGFDAGAPSPPTLTDRGESGKRVMPLRRARSRLALTRA